VSRRGALFLQQSREYVSHRKRRFLSRAQGGGEEGAALARMDVACVHHGCFCMAAVLLNVPEKLSRSLVVPTSPG